MQLFVKDLVGKTLTVYANAHEQVWQIKKQIYEKTNIPACDQRLLFAGKQLEDFQTLGYYKVQRESTFHLVLRLLSGKPSPNPLPSTIDRIEGFSLDTQDCFSETSTFLVRDYYRGSIIHGTTSDRSNNIVSWRPLKPVCCSKVQIVWTSRDYLKKVCDVEPMPCRIIAVVPSAGSLKTIKRVSLERLENPLKELQVACNVTAGSHIFVDSSGKLIESDHDVLCIVDGECIRVELIDPKVEHECVICMDAYTTARMECCNYGPMCTACYTQVDRCPVCRKAL